MSHCRQSNVRRLESPPQPSPPSLLVIRLLNFPVSGDWVAGRDVRSLCIRPGDFLLLLVTVLVLSTLGVTPQLRASGAERVAKVFLHCQSLKFGPSASTTLPPYTLSLSVTSAPSIKPNSELRPNFFNSIGDFKELVGFYYLAGPAIFVPDDFILGLPDLVDGNQDGVPDFYQTVLPIKRSVSHGVVDFGLDGQADLEATWTRTAGSSSGRCSAYIRQQSLNIDAVFPISFQILEYSGTYRYRVVGSHVDGWVELARRDATDRTLSGPLSLEVLTPDLVQYAPGSWTTGDGDRMAFSGFLPVGEKLYVEDQSIPFLDRFGTSYSGLVLMQDGDPTTKFQDYRTWWFRLEDDNDSNGDGIPDLSDPVPTLVVPDMRLGLDAGTGGLRFQIEGCRGLVVVLERSSQMSSATWMPEMTITPQADPEAIVVPTPDSASFWRLRFVRTASP